MTTRATWCMVVLAAGVAHAGSAIDDEAPEAWAAAGRAASPEALAALVDGKVLAEAPSGEPRPLEAMGATKPIIWLAAGLLLAQFALAAELGIEPAEVWRYDKKALRLLAALVKKATGPAPRRVPEADAAAGRPSTRRCSVLSARASGLVASRAALVRARDDGRVGVGREVGG